jgi:hypothetical protein
MPGANGSCNQQPVLSDRSRNMLLSILFIMLHTCMLSAVAKPCCIGSLSEQLKFEVEPYLGMSCWIRPICKMYKVKNQNKNNSKIADDTNWLLSHTVEIIHSVPQNKLTPHNQGNDKLYEFQYPFSINISVTCHLHSYYIFPKCENISISRKLHPWN